MRVINVSPKIIGAQKKFKPFLKIEHFSVLVLKRRSGPAIVFTKFSDFSFGFNSLPEAEIRFLFKFRLEDKFRQITEQNFLALNSVRGIQKLFFKQISRCLF